MPNTSALVLPHAVAAIGQDDDLRTDRELRGLTVTWLPGGHGVTMLVGGSPNDDGHSTEPALSLFIHALSIPRLLTLVERMVTFTPVIGPPPGEKYEILNACGPSEGPLDHLYDPTANPFSQEANLGWHRLVRCVILAQRTQFQPALAVASEVNPFLDGLAVEERILMLNKYIEMPEGAEDPAGWTGTMTAYPADETGWRPNERRVFVIDLSVRGRVRVYLERHEVIDLMAVLQYQLHQEKRQFHPSNHE